ncbi:MAG: HU family DNA-binding protein [Clostridia bacterium]|nr:HU family DNA-binding protein [Clostridia bacterium]
MPRAWISPDPLPNSTGYGKRQSVFSANEQGQATIAERLLNKKRRMFQMNKTELTAAIAQKSGLSAAASAKALNAAIEAVTEALAKGEKVQLVGFGTFEVRERAERTAHNPATHEIMTVPAGKTPAFKAGAALKNAVK